jgi:hypothetical protein
MLSVMSRTRRTIKSELSFPPARSLIVAVLLAGLFGMHGLSSSDTTSSPLRLGASSVAAMMPMPATVQLASAHVMSTAHAVLSSEAALPAMPMPSGHGSHDMLHACLAILSALVALALLVMALTRTRTRMTPVAVQRLRLRHRAAVHRHKPLRLSITQLGISRT